MAYVNLLDIIYPINSIYMTNDPNETPASRVGGTWVEINSGKYLMAAAGTYLAGTEGGSNAVVLTVSQMPSHYHKTTVQGTVSNVPYGGSTTCASINPSGTTNNSTISYTNTIGENVAHSNMPEYHGVRIFYRTA